MLAFIKNSSGEYLIQKTSARKKGIWALPGGHVKSGQTSLEAIKEEILEEMGYNIKEDNIKLFKTYKYENAFKDVYLINEDLDLTKVKIEPDEVEEIQYLSKEGIYDLIANDKIRKTNIDAIDDLFNS